MSVGKVILLDKLLTRKTSRFQFDKRVNASDFFTVRNCTYNRNFFLYWFIRQLSYCSIHVKGFRHFVQTTWRERRKNFRVNFLWYHMKAMSAPPPPPPPKKSRKRCACIEKINQKLSVFILNCCPIHFLQIFTYSNWSFLKKYRKFLLNKTLNSQASMNVA